MEPNNWKMEDREIGIGKPCIIIGEIAQAHDGSLGNAHAYIDAIANAGADAIKFQTHIAEAESTPGEPWRIKFSYQDQTRYEYWKRMEFTKEQWSGLSQHAKDRGLIFLSSPFSIEAAKMLNQIGIPAWKVASGETATIPLIEYFASTGLPILLSTGMSTMDEIDQIVDLIKKHKSPLAIMQCTTAYPCPPEKIGLNLISHFRERFRWPIGLSDHSGTIFAGLAAATLGIQLLEVHVTLSRELFGPDVPASITTSELHQLVQGIRFIEKMTANPVQKDLISNEMQPLRSLFSKSIVVKFDLPKGTLLKSEHLTTKKPGTGIPSSKLEATIGRRLRRDKVRDTLLQEEDLQPLE